MPVIQLIMFGYVVSSDVRDIPTAVVDYDRTRHVRAGGRRVRELGLLPDRRAPAVPRPTRGRLMDGNDVQVAIVVIPKGSREQVLERTPAPVEVDRRRLGEQDVAGRAGIRERASCAI